jgi:hypothetical protein
MYTPENSTLQILDDGTSTSYQIEVEKTLTTIAESTNKKGQVVESEVVHTYKDWPISCEFNNQDYSMIEEPLDGLSKEEMDAKKLTAIYKILNYQT